MDLRPTKKRVGGVYRTDPHSIRPFSYRIIRPSNLFEGETIDLILSGYERMLTWLEEIGGSLDGSKRGTYFVFQRDQHVSFLGSPTDGTAGLGVMSNAYIVGVLGLLGFSPFASTSDCLSLLDRRFWILDTRLDALAPLNSFAMKVAGPGDTPYTGFTSSPESAVRPVLPDRINVALDTTDRFRPLRYTWLAYRTNTITGTLAAIRRYDEELPKRLAEQQALNNIKQSGEGVT